jgi:DNA-binding NarL/FixJ family response regulator
MTQRCPVAVFYRRMQLMISIAVASENENDRKAIATLLARHDDFYVVGMGKDGCYAIKSVKEQQPDIIITDCRLNGFEITDLTPVIKRYSPSTALIVLYSDAECACMARALKAGVSGYISKGEISDELAESVRCVFYGGLYFSQTMRNLAQRYFSAWESIGNVLADLSPVHFTQTELCIFKNITLGRTDREIARDLNMSIGSLRNCVYHAKQETGLKNRTQISVYALLSGMINPNKIMEELLKK